MSKKCTNYSWNGCNIGRVSLARENEAGGSWGQLGAVGGSWGQLGAVGGSWGQLGAVGGRRSIFSMLKYRTSFCFWL